MRPLKIWPLLAACSAFALGAAACREDEPAGFASYGVVPANGLLPAASPAPVRYVSPDDGGYGFAERAYGLDQAFYQTPPDSGFDYGGARPYVWRTNEDWRMYAEPYDDGYRNYYYEPGAQRPYFVRDNQYGYGFDKAGNLTGLFSLAGQLLSSELLRRQAPAAGQYLARAAMLRQVPQQSWYDVPATAWSAQAPRFAQAQDPWFEAAQREADWLAYRERTRAMDLARFEPEWRRRDALWDKAVKGPNPPPWAPAWGLREKRGEIVWKGKGWDKRGDRLESRVAQGVIIDDRGGRKRDEVRVARAEPRDERGRGRDEDRGAKDDRGEKDDRGVKGDHGKGHDKGNNGKGGGDDNERGRGKD